jgi:protein-L-isoaspartate(D-aspartate) O-methyltransferase
MLEDGFREQGLRKQLVETIAKKGINNKTILIAIGKIPRHFFMDSAFINRAYEDSAFPIGSGQTISQPYTVAFQTELLKLEKGMKVLEVGTGSGYQSAVLLELGMKVFTIERQRELYLKTRSFLPKIGYRPHFFFGDGYKGKPTYGPFHRILITAGAPVLPEELLDQLVPGGILVIPLGKDTQIMTRYTKMEDATIKKETFGSFAFVPMLKGTAND